MAATTFNRAANGDAANDLRAQDGPGPTGTPAVALIGQPVHLVIVEVRRHVARVAFLGWDFERAQMPAISLRALQ